MIASGPVSNVILVCYAPTADLVKSFKKVTAEFVPTHEYFYALS